MCARLIFFETNTQSNQKPITDNAKFNNPVIFFPLDTIFPCQNLYSSFSFFVFRFVPCAVVCLFGVFSVHFCFSRAKKNHPKIVVRETNSDTQRRSVCGRLQEIEWKKKCARERRALSKIKSQQLWRQIKPTTPGKACQRNHHRLMSSNKNVTDDIHYLWICDILLRILVRKMAITRARH